MLSKETVKFVILSLRIADRLYSHPLTWHEETRSVRVREKGLWRWHLLTLLMGAYGLFAVARFLEDFLLLGKPLSDCILSIYFAIGHIYFNTIQQNLRVHKYDMASFLTLFINFDASTASESASTQFSLDFPLPLTPKYPVSMSVSVSVLSLSDTNAVFLRFERKECK